MLLVDGQGLPLACRTASASPAEVTLVEDVTAQVIVTDADLADLDAWRSRANGPLLGSGQASEQGGGEETPSRTIRTRRLCFCIASPGHDEALPITQQRQLTLPTRSPQYNRPAFTTDPIGLDPSLRRRLGIDYQPRRVMAMRRCHPRITRYHRKAYCFRSLIQKGDAIILQHLGDLMRHCYTLCRLDLFTWGIWGYQIL